MSMAYKRVVHPVGSMYNKQKQINRSLKFWAISKKRRKVRWIQAQVDNSAVIFEVLSHLLSSKKILKCQFYLKKIFSSLLDVSNALHLNVYLYTTPVWNTYSFFTNYYRIVTFMKFSVQSKWKITLQAVSQSRANLCLIDCNYRYRGLGNNMQRLLFIDH